MQNKDNDFKEELKRLVKDNKESESICLMNKIGDNARKTIEIIRKEKGRSK